MVGEPSRLDQRGTLRRDVPHRAGWRRWPMPELVWQIAALVTLVVVLSGFVGVFALIWHIVLAMLKE